MFICSNCQKTYSKWMGQCENCGQWNTLKEIENSKIAISKGKKGKNLSTISSEPVRLSQISSKKGLVNPELNIVTGLKEFDNTIGGRILPGQVILLAGSPGIGKSTLTLQIADALSQKNLSILYICGEESPEQIKHRADRLKLQLSNVLFLPETNIKAVESFVAAKNREIDLIIVDSIQTMYDPSVLSSSGSVSQIAESTNTITGLAKGYGIITFIIGHVTKSGDIAGPKILEHMVDTVLYFEGEKRYEFRVLRVEKNRFGPTDEAGIFKMTELGLSEVKDTKELFENKNQNSSGSVYGLILEGTRPVVVEVQALATKTYFTNPRRTTSGFDLNRLYILLAILDKKRKLKTGELDVYVNITGGIRITDPAIDLAVAAAIISSIKDTVVDKRNIYFGELGLTGEVRKVYLEDKRIKEAHRLGFEKIFSSKNHKNISMI
jgi:DNA repair protein RadA/Sms